MRVILSYLQTDLGLTIADQAERSGLSYKTLRRWLAGGRVSPACGSRYLSWALGAACDLLRHDSADRSSASIPRGCRIYSAVVGDAGAWSWLLIVLDGRQLHRADSGTSAVRDLAALTEELHQRAASWCAPLRELDRRAPRLGRSADHLDRRWWAAQMRLQAAHVGLVLAQGLASQGALTGDDQARSLRDYERALADMAEVGAALRGDEP